MSETPAQDLNAEIARLREARNHDIAQGLPEDTTITAQIDRLQDILANNA